MLLYDEVDNAVEYRDDLVCDVFIEFFDECDDFVVLRDGDRNGDEADLRDEEDDGRWPVDADSDWDVLIDEA